MTAHTRRDLVILITAALMLFIRADFMLVVAAVLMLAGLMLQLPIHPHHHGRHA